MLDLERPRSGRANIPIFPRFSSPSSRGDFASKRERRQRLYTGMLLHTFPTTRLVADRPGPNEERNRHQIDELTARTDSFQPEEDQQSMSWVAKIWDEINILVKILRSERDLSKKAMGTQSGHKRDARLYFFVNCDLEIIVHVGLYALYIEAMSLTDQVRTMLTGIFEQSIHFASQRHCTCS